MPDPKRLKVGDKIKFVALPDGWSAPSFKVPRCSIAFMKKMIARIWPSRVCRIDEDGYPWIQSRIREGGRIVHHDWMICEQTGWRLVRNRL